MIVALDAFGTDHAPLPEVEGAVLAIKENACDKILLVGKEDILKKELDKYYYDTKRIEVINASQVVAMDDKASTSVRKSMKDSSLVQAILLHKDGKADAAVSAGNTGAVMAAALLNIGRIKNVMRPAISIHLPTMRGNSIMLDVGANVDCTPDYLVQFARLGSLYSQFFFKIDNPKLALLNIGEESMKGNELAKKTHQRLLVEPGINFVGNIEGKEVMKGEVNVVICDGFVGNVMLKTLEGAAVSIFRMMKEQIKKDWIAKIGAILSFPVYQYLKKKLDHSEHGGALLTGLNGTVLVAHGSSNAIAIKNAVRFSAKIAESGFLEHAREYFEHKSS